MQLIFLNGYFNQICNLKTIFHDFQMQPHETQQSYSLEEYFALDAATVDVKHEFFGGDIFAKAGAHPRHNTVCANLIGELRDGFKRKNRPCRVYTSDQRVKSGEKINGRVGYSYPDVSVVCGTPQFSTDNPPTLLNPMLVVEVLSDSTRNYDGGKKLGYYIANPDITDIMLVDYELVGIMHFRRAEQPEAIGGDWILRTYQSLELNLLIPSLELEIPLSEIYRDVEFTDAQDE